MNCVGMDIASFYGWMIGGKILIQSSLPDRIWGDFAGL